MDGWKHLRNAIAIGILMFQVGAIVYARFYPTRYFCSAPNDAITKFKVQVTTQGRELQHISWISSLNMKQLMEKTNRLKLWSAIA
jgi:hypothetical protein